MPATAEEMEITDLFSRTGDARLRDQVIMANQGLVEKLARRFVGRGVPLEDLVQVGNIGLINAVDRFDARRGLKLSTYATPCIIGEIRRYFRDKEQRLKVPRSLRELVYCISKLEDEMAGEGVETTPDMLADILGVSENEVLEALTFRASSSPLSIDQDFSSADDGDGSFFEDRYGEEDRAIQAVVESDELRDAVDRLPPRLKKVIELRFLRGLSQTEVAKVIGSSQMHVSRLQASALVQMRATMTSEVPTRSAVKNIAVDPNPVAREETVMEKAKTHNIIATPKQLSIVCAIWAGFSRLERGVVNVEALAKLLRTHPFAIRPYVGLVIETMLEGSEAEGYVRGKGSDVLLQRGNITLGGIDFLSGHVYRLDVVVPKLIERGVSWAVSDSVVVPPNSKATEASARQRKGKVAPVAVVSAAVAPTEIAPLIQFPSDGASVIARLLSVHPAIVQGEPSTDIATAIKERRALIEHLQMEQMVLEAAQAILSRPSVKLVP
ncbi:MAG: sigma-70 family RNA polymerase sigma factor [Patescibacteria group bacterium]|jgi:RNA polymerase sigma-B factor